MEQDEYLKEKEIWFLCYLNNRCHSKKMRSMLIDQIIYSHSSEMVLEQRETNS